MYFRQAMRFATRNGYKAAFPLFTSNYPAGENLMQLALLGDIASDRISLMDVTRRYADLQDVPGQYRLVNSAARDPEQQHGLPDFENRNPLTGTFRSVAFLDQSQIVVLEVPFRVFGKLPLSKPGRWMAVAHAYAISQGYGTAYPTFEPPKNGVYRIVCIPKGMVDIHEISIDLMMLDQEPIQAPVQVDVVVVLGQMKNDDGSLMPVAETKDFYEEFFFGLHPYSLRSYYAAVTHGRLRVTGKVTTWLPLDLTQSTHEANNAAGQFQQRYRAILKCREAATQAGINIPPGAHFVAILNNDTDWGGYNGDVLLPHEVMGRDLWSHSRAAHEFGHALGLPDAYGYYISNGVESIWPYGDYFCIMSYAANGGRFLLPFRNQMLESGPVLNAVYADRLGGIPSSKIKLITPGFLPQYVELCPLTTYSETGSLMVVVQNFHLSGYKFYLEFHKKTRWDRNTWDHALAIHIVFPGDTKSYMLQVEQVGALFPDHNQMMISPDGRLGIRFARMEGDNAIVKIWLLPLTLQRKYVSGKKKGKH